MRITEAEEAPPGRYIEFRSALGCGQCWAVHLCRLCAATIPAGGRGLFDMKKQRAECEGIRREYARILNNFAGILERNPEAFRMMEKDAVFSRLDDGGISESTLRESRAGNLIEA